MITITAAAVWLCLITHVACDVVITVNNNGSDNDTCCVNGTCPCSSLSSALHDVSDNTVINITSASVTLQDIVGMGSGNLNNIIITGNGATIMCNNTGGVYCESCSDITIMGIIWYQCGLTNKSIRYQGIYFYNISNLLLQNCSFQYSSGCPVYIKNAQGKLLIDSCNFSNTHVYGPYNYDEWGGLYIYYTNRLVELGIYVFDSIFDYNRCRLVNCTANVYAVIMLARGLKLTFMFKNTQFLHNSGGLSLSTNALHSAIQLINVTFCNNTKWGAYIRMDQANSENKTNVTLTVLSSVFANNINALRCEIYSTAHESPRPIQKVTISGSAFVNNTAVNISGAVSTRIVLFYGDLAIHISNSMFFNNLNGAVNIHTTPGSVNSHATTAEIKFTDVKIFNTSMSKINNGGDASISTAIVVYDSRVTISFTRVNFTSNNNFDYNGRVLYVSKYNEISYYDSYFSFTINECTFINNAAFDHVVALLAPICQPSSS